MSLDYDRLVAAYRNWNTEEHKYMVVGFNGNVFFSNDIDCNGYRYFSKPAFTKHMKQNGKWK